MNQILESPDKDFGSASINYASIFNSKDTHYLEINDKIEKSQQRKRTYEKRTKWKLQKLNIA